MDPVPQVTHVNVATLPWVDHAAQKLHRRLRSLIRTASELIRVWYEKHHYHDELHKAATPEQIAIAQKSFEDALDTLKWDELFTPLFEYLVAAYQGGTELPPDYQYRPLRFNILHPDERAVAYANARSAELVGKTILDDGSIIDNPNPEWAIGPKLRSEIRQAVTEALQDEPSPQDLARTIQDLASFHYPRARMIARTELAMAYNRGHADQARELGFTEKRWLLGEAHLQPDECDDNAAQGWIPLADLYRSGDEQPPAHPNCVCAEVYRRSGEE